jgi:phosphoribosylformimino-5-aminoimidazole carboxamide ribotide isomerase
MELIPAIDIIEGKCVRLSKGDFNKKIIYSDNPLEVAKAFQGAGLKRLHIVDLDGANGKSLQNIFVLEQVAENTKLIIDYGGGLKTTEHLTTAFNTGAAMVSVGSIAIKDRVLFSEWINIFGTDKFLPGADVLNKVIKIHGWKEDTSVNIFDFIQSLLSLHVQTIFCTDISRDGMMQGPSVQLYKEILNKFPSLHLIASGGVARFDDLLRLEEAGCTGAIVGKAFYEEKITMTEIEQFLKR